MNSATNTTTSNEYIYIYFYTVSIVGSVGNFIVALVYWNKKDKQTSTFFILVLAISDLIVCLILVPMTIHMERILFETSSVFFCKAFYFLTTTVVPSCSLLMTAIAFDRYFCICMVSRNVMNLHRARLSVAVLIAISVLLGIIPLMSSTIVDQEQPALNYSIQLCTIDIESKHTTLGFLIMPFKLFYDFVFLACVLVITLLYLLIYKKIYISRKFKRNRKREILLSSLIKQAENGTFPESLLLKAKIESDRQNRPSSHLMFFKNCCLNDNRELIEESVNMSKTEDTYLSYRDLEESSTGRKKSSSSIQGNFYNAIRYDIAEQKIILSLMSSQNNVNIAQKKEEEQKDMALRKYSSKSDRHLSSISSISSTSQIKHGLIKLKAQEVKRKTTRGLLNRDQQKFKRDPTINSKIVPFLILIKDTRTAFILFVISIVFILTYLPSILATHSLLPNDNLYILYLYFSNSALNPIVYSFINRNFRSELIKLFLNKSKPIFSASRFSSFNLFSGNGNGNSEMKTI